MTVKLHSTIHMLEDITFQILSITKKKKQQQNSNIILNTVIIIIIIAAININFLFSAWKPAFQTPLTILNHPGVVFVNHDSKDSFSPCTDCSFSQLFIS